MERCFIVHDVKTKGIVNTQPTFRKFCPNKNEKPNKAPPTQPFSCLQNNRSDQKFTSYSFN